ncbi:hypothetical protein DB31_8752 [Hyalangium minutum]|uniref:Uncharacterized protein n=1 Tax=Hyalangium minutum TaxID=394096 RepID=A0A085WI86_9BACT|nr:hypothetical protein DB31_8665 [Hyalangium minutum]KFE67399.1 hypothetical protein DB31_8752 [Hyalangium minutum]
MDLSDVGFASASGFRSCEARGASPAQMLGSRVGGNSRWC